MRIGVGVVDGQQVLAKRIGVSLDLLHLPVVHEEPGLLVIVNVVHAADFRRNAVLAEQESATLIRIRFKRMSE